jgi:hypothetical protein
MWVEFMEVQNAYIAETWRELFAAEGLRILVVPLTDPWTDAGDLAPRKLYVPHGKLHVAKEILRKI